MSEMLEENLVRLLWNLSLQKIIISTIKVTIIISNNDYGIMIMDSRIRPVGSEAKESGLYNLQYIPKCFSH